MNKDKLIEWVKKYTNDILVPPSQWEIQVRFKYNGNTFSVISNTMKNGQKPFSLNGQDCWEIYCLSKPEHDIDRAVHLDSFDKFIEKCTRG